MKRRRQAQQYGGGDVYLRAAVLVCALGLSLSGMAQGLPDAPSALMMAQLTTAGVGAADVEQVPAKAHGKHERLAPCQSTAMLISPEAVAAIAAYDKAFRPCHEENPLQTIVSSPDVRPLNAKQKFHLAVHDVKDPFNLIVLTATTGIFVATNAHSAYGPGMKGFGTALGYNAVQDMTGEFFATFAIPALTHEDPRYHRMGGNNIPRRALHAALHTYVSQHDDGRLMPNYAVLGAYWIVPNLSSLYVPGAAVSEKTIAHGVALGLATDPTGNLIGEFLPDIAKHIHVHFFLAQRALQQVTGEGTTP